MRQRPLRDSVSFTPESIQGGDVGQQRKDAACWNIS
jgi:hypothetical protein